MLTLTPTEEKIMLVLWKLESAKLNDIIQCFPDPKPAQNAMSTMLGILVKKDLVEHVRVSRSYVYTPKLSKLEYTIERLKQFMNDFYDGDFEKFKNHVDILQY